MQENVSANPGTVDASQPASDVLQTPNEQVAGLAAAALKQAGLVPADRAGELERRLAAGTASAQDWRLWIELAMPKR